MVLFGLVHLVQFCSAWSGMVGSVWFRSFQSGSIRFDSVLFGLVQSGLVRFSRVRLDSVRSSST